MVNETVGMRVTDIPMDFYNSVTQHIVNFCIGIVRVEANDSGEDAILIGSGTLVDFNSSSCILTAQHVIDALPKKGTLGFVISEKLHKYVLNVQNLSTIKVGKGKDDCTGPDLGIIVLPQPTIGNIRAHKSFYNINNKRDWMLKSPPETNLGVWCICGIPDIETKVIEPQKGFNRVKAFLEFCGFGGISKEYNIKKYDYFDFEVQYNDRTGSPLSFQGVSGGGLWQVIIAQKPNDELIMKEAILSGVAYYQTELVDNKRTIKCHGRKSIFRNAFNIMKKKKLLISRK